MFFEIFITSQTFSISVELDWKVRKGLILENKGSWFLVILCVALRICWRVPTVACTLEQGTVNARVSAFRLHAPRNAFCAVGASLGPKGSVVRLGLQRAHVLLF